MRKIYGINILIVILSLLSTFVVLFVLITQLFNFQLYILQDVYNTIDKSGNMIRAILMPLLSLSAGFFIFRSKNKANSSQSIKWGIVAVLIGLIIGLLVFYTLSCCESLVAFNFGFPLSWLRSFSRESYRLPVPEFQYLVQNLGNMYQWYIDIFSLLSDVFFWYCTGVTVYLAMVRDSLVQSDKKGIHHLSQKT